MTISDIVYQNKDLLDIFSDKAYSKFNQYKHFFPVDIFPS